MLKSHYPQALAAIREAQQLVAGRKVKSVTAIQEDICLESYPCQGHGGAKITLEDGTVLKVDCSSVSIGAIEKFYFPGATSHFSGYVKDLEIGG